ncbi:hypothetical protein [Acetivibrio cellulolyticus]|uniref:hypothetical protein n=1 Tax=Acetivibrio cellulolyticus TaxID=35830 RepID=UPI0003112889|nr:hypothetical protein [Acetivibrio cellulolyticus]
MFARINRMLIVDEDNEKFIICDDCEPEFWGNMENEVLLKDLGSGTCKVRYNDVVNQIMGVSNYFT